MNEYRNPTSEYELNRKLSSPLSGAVLVMSNIVYHFDFSEC